MEFFLKGDKHCWGSMKKIPKIIIREPKEPFHEERRGNCVYVYDAENVCIGMQLAKFDKDDKIQEQFKDSMVILPK